MKPVLIALFCATVLGIAMAALASALDRRRTARAAKAAADAWRPEDYTSGPPRPVPPEAP